MEVNYIVEDSIVELLTLLSDSSLNRNKTAEHIVKSISTFFDSEHSKSELDLVFSLLFRLENSLLYFIEKAYSNKSLVSGVREALTLVSTLFNKFKDQLPQYIAQIKEVCYKCARDSSSADLQEKAYQIITAVISSKVPLPPDGDLNVSALVTFIFNQKLGCKKSLSPTVLGSVYELFGAIAQHYPANCSDSTINSVLRNILTELKNQLITAKDVKAPIIRGCMLALKGMLVHFTRDYNEDPENSKAIYSYLKTVCTFQDNISRRMFQRAALEVLTVHIDQMWGWALGDYRWWLKELSIWAGRQGEDRYAGIDALCAFHRRCWVHLSQYTESSSDKDMAKVLLEHYKQTFTNPRAAGYDLQLAVEGFGALASVASKLIQDQDFITLMFRIILQRAQTDYTKSEDNSTEQLGKYLESLSNICRELKTINTDQLAALQQLTRLLMANYPHTNNRTQSMVVSALCTTILNMSLCEGQLLDRFLYPVIYQGIIVSCGQCLAEEAELRRELTGEEVVTYQNFLSLWTGLLNLGYENRVKVSGVTPSLRRLIFGKLHDCLIKSLIEILSKLDVEYQKQTTEELEMKADPESSLKGTKPEDHNILCNLANLYKDLLRAMDGEQLTKWLPELITTIINHSVRLPLVSGFYKLVAAVLGVADRTNYFQDQSEDHKSLEGYVMRYLEDVVVHCKQYKNDLQASSLLAVIAAPVHLIQSLLAGIPPMMQMIFQLGQGYVSLAHSGMDALERWQDKLPSDQLKPILYQVLPLFDPYLRSTGILIEEESEEEIKLSKTQQKRAKRMAESTQLSKLQERMLKLLSKLDSATCLSLLRQENTSAVAWTAEPMLTLKIPFPDRRPVICLDALLPRVVELALTSSDRQTKSAACEVLHALVILFTGLGVSMPQDGALTSLLRHLMPALLQLGCGSDLVARQLFHLLVMQLMHWFSSRRMMSRPEQPAAVLEAIWDGVTHESDTALQDFSALCLREFVSWAIKQSSDQELAKSPASIKGVVRQINTYCVHPSLSKRVGAAIAFNHLAPLLREHLALVEKFWVELLYNLVRNLSLSGCSDNHPACLALDHVLRVIQKNADLFNKVSSERRVPAALQSGQLRDVLHWLLLQCGNTSIPCAKKCRHLVKALTSLVPGFTELSDLAEKENMIEVCEGGGNGTELPIQPSLSDGKRLLASLDCYLWCISNGIVSPDSIPQTPKKLVPCVEYFINILDLTAPPPVVSNREISILTQTKCSLIESLFDLLGLMGSSVASLPFTFWNQRFWRLVAMCIFRPHEVGFDWRRREQAGVRSLADTLRELLRTLREQLRDLQDLYSQMSLLVEVDCQASVERLALMWQGLATLHIGETQYVRGLGTLHRSNMLPQIRHGCSWNGNILLRGIFSALFDPNGTVLHPDSSVGNFTKELLTLAILLGADVNVALSCILDTTVAQDPGVTSPTTRGQHFLLLFEDQLVTLLLTDPVSAISQLLEEPSRTTTQVVLLLLDSCRYTVSKKQFNRRAEPLVEAVCMNWAQLVSWAGSTIARRAQLVGLVKAMVQTVCPSMAVGCLARHKMVTTWLYKQITDPDTRPEFKADVIDLLPAVVLQKRDLKLQETLDYLQDKHFPLESNEWRPGSVERDTLVTLYQALLRALVASGSVTILRTVTCAARDKEHACAASIDLALGQFMKQHPQERQKEALIEVFRFSEDSKDNEVRLRVVENFLIPMLLKASYGAVVEFYTEKIQILIDILEEKLRLYDTDYKNKQQLIRRIVALHLISPLFQRVNKAELENVNNPLVKAPKTPNNAKLLKYFCNVLFLTRRLDCSSEELQDLFRRMQCCAYKSLMTVICNTEQSEEFCSTLMFKENKDKIWQKLVPTNPKYTFPIVFDDYPKMKKQLVQIRSLSESQKPQPLPYLISRSQSLFNSSLEEDFTRYDFSMYKVRNREEVQQILNQQTEPTALELEMDCVNDHECMATLCAVIKHLCDKFSHEGQVPRLPPWMEYLKTSLSDRHQPANCRVFIVRLIMNCQSYFRPHASFWVAPILKAVIDNCFDNGLNFLIHDVVCMLYDWHPVYVPNSTTDERLLASDFLRRLVQHTPNERAGVSKYNVEVVKCVVSMWKTFLVVPYQEMMDLIVSKSDTSQTAESGILLADIFLAHQILPFNETGKTRYYENLLANLKNQTMSIYKSTATVIGKILRTVCEEGSYALTGTDDQFFSQVQEHIAFKGANSAGTGGARNIEQFVYILHRIQANYPAIVKSFVIQCIDQLKLPASFREMMMDCLTTALDFDFRYEAFSLVHSQLPKFITDNSSPDVQVATLRFVKKLIVSLAPAEMCELLPAVLSHKNNKRVQFRQVVYDIVSWLYDNYKPLRDERAQAQVKEAQTVLVAGLTDPDKKLRDKLYEFWTVNDHLAQNNSCSRLVDILRKLYSPSCEDMFVPIVINLLLQICEQTNEFDQNIFDNPLGNCAFEKYHVSGSWRTQHAAFVPMFADTLASQLSSASLDSLDSLSNIQFQLRATQSQSSLYSSSLVVSMSSSDYEEASLYSFGGQSASMTRSFKQGKDFGSRLLTPIDTTNGGSQIQSPTPILLRRRLLKDQNKVGRQMARENTAKADRQQRLLAERTKRREGEVRLTREYRKGDYPDIEITYCSIIRALQTLARRDQLVARQLLVCLYKELVKTDENIPGLSAALYNILKTSTRHLPILMASVLEMCLLRPEHCLTPAATITDVCKNSHQISLGVLLVEAKLMANSGSQPPAKRARSSAHADDWVYLAEIYHSMEEKDVVQGLFEDKIAEACASSVREALQVEDQKRWKLALQLYKQSLPDSRESPAENFLFEACFKCLAHLSNWTELNDTLKKVQLDGLLDDIWTDDWNKDHLLPWLFLSEIHCTQNTSVLSVADDFNIALSQWLADNRKAEHIRAHLGEYLSVVQIVKDDVQRSKMTCDNSLLQFLSMWQQLDSLSNNLRVHHLLRLQSIMDIHHFLSLPSAASGDWANKVNRLLDQWNKTNPTARDDLVAWETRAVYRHIFASKLEPSATVESLKMKLKRFKAQTQLKIVKCALEQQNFYVTQKYMGKTKNEVSSVEDRNWWELYNSRFVLLRAQLERDPTSLKVQKTLNAWDGIKRLQGRNATMGLDAPLSLGLLYHTAEFYSTLLFVVEKAPVVVDQLSEDVRQRLDQHLDPTGGDIPSQLRNRVLNCLQQAVGVAQTADNLADSYFRLVRFCHEQEDPMYHAELIQSLLRAMRHGSAEARRLFPCLLELPLLLHKDLFINESGQVPEWMFLTWVSQLLASLDTEIGSVLAPLLIQLATAYPKALQFPFQLSCEMYKNDYPITNLTVNRLKPLLALDTQTATTLQALACVCQPHHCLIYHLDRLIMAVALDTDSINDIHLQMKTEAYPPEEGDRIKGRAFSDLKKFTVEIEEVLNKYLKKKLTKVQCENKLKEKLNAVIQDNKSEKTQNKRNKRIELASFSPWLADGYEGEVEIPGQYTGESRPLPQQHVTIVGFKRHVKSQLTLRAPVQVTILGNDAKDHRLLVKFGEDLRQDQRIQQLFVLMNHLLREDAAASRSGLSVDTYMVSPLNSRLGVIEWVDKTISLHDFMVRDKELEKKAGEALNMYCEWFKKYNPSVFFNTIKREQAVPMYNRVMNHLPKFMFRDAVWRLAASPEAFVHLRTQMLTSHACLSICHWLLGIGDRHLSNTLVRLDTGRFLGIDFGHAFGTATFLISIPELLPIRLSPQIVNLASPLSESGLLKETMVHTLQVMRDNYRVLLATMSVFINEPSLDWLKNAQKQCRENIAYDEENWYPREKVAAALNKLKGSHPRTVTAQDLRSGHASKPHYNSLLELLHDDTDTPWMRDMPEQGLTARQQVECLIAQATNRHILSKTYYGWQAWM